MAVPTDREDWTSWRQVVVPAPRMSGWVERFAVRHGPPEWLPEGSEQTRLSAPDGAVAVIRPAFDGAVVADLAGLDARLQQPAGFGLVLVRRGGYAVGRVGGTRLTASKCGTRYVQGRSKKGGWSQQRYARRRRNQADSVVIAAAAAVQSVFGREPLQVVGGGDRSLVAQTLEEAGRDAGLAGRWLAVPDPRRAVLEAAVTEARAVTVLLNDLA